MRTTTTRNEEPAGLGINGVIPGDGECVVEDCPASCPENALMCRTHWRRVPVGLKENMKFVFGRWNQGKGTLADVRDAQWACVDAV